MEIRMFDESGGICRPLQSQTQQPCIVHWTPLPSPVSSNLFWDTASEARLPPYCWSLLTTSRCPPLLIPPEKNRNIQEKQKRDNLLNRVAMTLQYISGTGLFTNYVDKFLVFFDHLPPSVDIFYPIMVDKKPKFLTT